MTLSRESDIEMISMDPIYMLTGVKGKFDVGHLNGFLCNTWALSGAMKTLFEFITIHGKTTIQRCGIVLIMS